MTDYKKLYDEEMDRQEWERFRASQEADRAYQRREAERRELLKQRRYDEINSAETWDEGFRKNISRLKHELRDSQAFARQSKDDELSLQFDDESNIRFWREQVAINKAAQQYLREEMKFIQPIIAKLEALIESLKRRARQRVLKRIEETMPGDSSTVECLVDGHPSDLLNW